MLSYLQVMRMITNAIALCGFERKNIGIRNLIEFKSPIESFRRDLFERFRSITRFVILLAILSLVSMYPTSSMAKIISALWCGSSWVLMLRKMLCLLMDKVISDKLPS